MERGGGRAVERGGRRATEEDEDRTETRARDKDGDKDGDTDSDKDGDKDKDRDKTETRTETRTRTRTGTRQRQGHSDGVNKLLCTDLRRATALVIYRNARQHPREQTPTQANTDTSKHRHKQTLTRFTIHTFSHSSTSLRSLAPASYIPSF